MNGDTILGFCDTGGGYTALYNSTIKRLGLETAIEKVKIKNEVMRYAHAEEIYKNENIPYPKIRNYYKSYIEKPFFEVPSANQESDFILEFIPHHA